MLEKSNEKTLVGMTELGEVLNCFSILQKALASLSLCISLGIVVLKGTPYLPRSF